MLRPKIVKTTYSRQRETKLTKMGSQFLRIDVRSLEPGRRLRPLLFVMQRGFPFESAQTVYKRKQCHVRILMEMHGVLVTDNGTVGDSTPKRATVSPHLNRFPTDTLPAKPQPIQNGRIRDALFTGCICFRLNWL